MSVTASPSLSQALASGLTATVSSASATATNATQSLTNHTSSDGGLALILIVPLVFCIWLWVLFACFQLGCNARDADTRPRFLADDHLKTSNYFPHWTGFLQFPRHVLHGQRRVVSGQIRCWTMCVVQQRSLFYFTDINYSRIIWLCHIYFRTRHTPPCLFATRACH